MLLENGIIFLQTLALEMFVEISLVTSGLLALQFASQNLHELEQFQQLLYPNGLPKKKKKLEKWASTA